MRGGSPARMTPPAALMFARFTLNQQVVDGPVTDVDQGRSRSMNTGRCFAPAPTVRAWLEGKPGLVTLMPQQAHPGDEFSNHMGRQATVLLAADGHKLVHGCRRGTGCRHLGRRRGAGRGREQRRGRGRGGGRGGAAGADCRGDGRASARSRSRGAAGRTRVHRLPGRPRQRSASEHHDDPGGAGRSVCPRRRAACCGLPPARLRRRPRPLPTGRRGSIVRARGRGVPVNLLVERGVDPCWWRACSPGRGFAAASPGGRSTGRCSPGGCPGTTR